MTFSYNDPIWVRFFRAAELQRHGTTFKICSPKEKIKAVILQNHSPADPTHKTVFVKLLLDEETEYYCVLKVNQADITDRYTEDQPPQFEIFSNGRGCLTLREFWVENLEYENELHNLPHVCSLSSKKIEFIYYEEEIPSEELFDIAGKLLCKPWVKPWSQQGEGNVPFNPSQVFTYDNDWAQMMCALRWLPATPIEVDEEAWYYFLEVLPPLMMSCYFEFEGQTHYLSYVMGEGTPLKGGFYKDKRHYLISVPASALVWKNDKSKAVTASELFYNR
jgi:hypothetical protein